MKWLEAVVEQAHEPVNRIGGASLVLQLPGGCDWKWPTLVVKSRRRTREANILNVNQTNQ